MVAESYHERPKYWMSDKWRWKFLKWQNRKTLARIPQFEIPELRRMLTPAALTCSTRL